MQPSLYSWLAILVVTIGSSEQRLVPGFRPPATPLWLLNPTIQVWSKGDQLSDIPTSHWIETQNMSLVGLIRMNNGTRILRFMGVTDEPIDPMRQIQCIVQPTQTKYVFQSDDIELNLTFIQSAFVHSLELASLPIGYLTHSIRSLSMSSTPDVQIYIELSADFVVNSIVSDKVVWQETRPGEHRWQAYNHAPFQTHGDRIKPDWGYLYVAGRSPCLRDSTQNNASLCRQAFLRGDRSLASRDDSQGPRSVQNGYPVSAFLFDHSSITSNHSSSSAFLVLFHDEQLSMDFFSQYQRPYWTKLYPSAQQLLDGAFQRFEEIQQQAEDYDQALIDRYTNTAGIDFSCRPSVPSRFHHCSRRSLCDTSVVSSSTSHGCLRDRLGRGTPGRVVIHEGTEF